MTQKEKQFIFFNRELKGKKITLTNKGTGEQVTDTISNLSFTPFTDKITIHLAKNGNHTMLRDSVDNLIKNKSLNMCVFTFSIAE